MNESLGWVPPYVWTVPKVSRLVIERSGDKKDERSRMVINPSAKPSGLKPVPGTKGSSRKPWKQTISGCELSKLFSHLVAEPPREDIVNIGVMVPLPMAGYFLPLVTWLPQLRDQASG
jgi:hypothetical protein